MPAATSVADLYTTKTTRRRTDNNTVTVSTLTDTTQKLTLVSTVFATVNGVEQPVTYSFEISPNEVNVQRLSLVYGELERPGRTPLLQSRARQLRQVTITVIISSRGATRFFESCQAQIDGLIALADLDADLGIHYPGIPEDMTWRITDLSFRTVRRNTANEVTIAEADITFTQSVTPQAVVPGMTLIKDVPGVRTVTGRRPAGATTGCQRTDGLTGRDADTACAVDTILAAGPPTGG